MTFAVSPLQPRHEAFVCAAFVNERKLARDSGLFILDDPQSRQSWWDAQWRWFWTMLARPTVRTLVAHGEDDANAYRGFISVDTSGRIPYLYYVYVKEVYRRAGHARALCAAAGFNPAHRFHYACRSQIGDRLTGSREVWLAGELTTLAPKYKLAKHDPLWARFGKERAND